MCSASDLYVLCCMYVLCILICVYCIQQLFEPGHGDLDDCFYIYFWEITKLDKCIKKISVVKGYDTSVN